MHRVSKLQLDPTVAERDMGLQSWLICTGPMSKSQFWIFFAVLTYGCIPILLRVPAKFKHIWELGKYSY
jgi:hypothetical protein